MSSYLISNLSKDEKIMCRAKINKLAIVGPLITAIFLLIIAVVGHLLLNKLLFHNQEFLLKNGAAPRGAEILVKVFVWFILTFIPVVVLIRSLIKTLSLEVVITNNRLFGKVGLISLKTIDIPIKQISNSSITCGFWGRMFNYYTVDISHAGMKIVSGTSKGLLIPAVSNAKEFTNTINKAIEENEHK
ncbi:MAG: PH domain-containing protein [Clostridia bacterium]|nr:PH domain-containing protein [Clostridia bacterium]